MKNYFLSSKSSLLKTVLFLFLFIGLQTTQAQTWKTPLASGGSYLTTQINDVFFVSATKGWLVGASGLIMTTNDGGETWTQQTSGTSASLLSVHFTSATNGVAVGSNGITIYTTDGGTTWTIVSLGTTSQMNSVFFVSPTKGWVCGFNGEVYTTNDGGVNWTQQNSGTTYQLTAVYFTSETTGIMLALNNGTIYTTTDGGTTWTENTTTTGTVYGLTGISFVSPTQAWAVGYSGTIITTTDGGVSWTPQTSGTVNDLNSVHFTSALNGCAVGNGGTILTTTDGGVIWTPQTSGTTYQLKSVCFTTGTTGIAVGATGTALKTTNSGASWSKKLAGTTNVLNAVSFASATQGWAVGNAGTILATTNGGKDWTAQTSGTSQALNSVSFVSATQGWAVGATGTILATTDGGATWISQTSGTTNTLSAVSFVSATQGWAVSSTSTNNVYTTNDGGATWTVQTFTGGGLPFRSVHFISATHGWAVSKINIIRTTDGGVSWIRSTADPSRVIEDVFFVSTTKGWCINDQGLIRTTNDGGATWTSQASGLSSTTGGNLYFTSATNGWATNGIGRIVTTTDGGTTWTSQATGLGVFKGMHFVTDNFGVAVGNGGAIYLYGTIADTTPPTVAITSTLSGTTSLTTIPVTITFSESVTGFIAGDITVSNGTVSGFAGSGTTYTFNITPATSGAVTVNIAAGVAQDAAANGNIVATQFSITYCATPISYTVTGTGSYCSGGTGVAVGLSNSETGVSYQLKKDGNNFGEAVTGSGSAISFGNQTTAATYTVLATRTTGGCTATMTGSATVSITTSTSHSTTASACDTYTWSVNSQTYTESGTYTYVSGCNTETLNLTITPSISHSTTASACDTYTWSVNSQTYTTSGTYTSVTGCNTETLNLTITPSTSNSTTASACDTYTWSVNSQTYTESGTYTSVTGCNTETLNLTITPSTENATTISACDTYTWSENGVTYTESGKYTKVTGCHTEVLNLTITPSTSNTTTASACDSYSWSVNETTYTESGTYTYSEKGSCHTETLVLTITPTTYNNTTITANNSYTWAANGQTYTITGKDAYTAEGSCHTETLNVTIVHIPNTKVKDAQCGTTLATPTTVIAANTVTGAQGYRFEVSEYNGENIGAVIDTVETTSSYFRLTQLSTGIVYNKKYSIKVAAMQNGAYGNFSIACPITASTAPLTKLTDAICNSTLALTTTAIGATTITGAQGYKFEVSEYIGDNINPTFLENIETTGTYFRLTNLTNGTSYNRKYQIRVAGKFNGEYAEFGQACTVTTPPIPLTKVKDAQCNSTLASLTSIITANAISGVDGYRFEVSEYDSNNVVHFVENIDATSAYFRLTQLTAGTTYYKKYAIRVAGKSEKSIGTFGASCDITTPAPSSKIKATQCGTSLAALNTAVGCDAVTGAQGYMFEVKENGELVGEITATTNYFRLTQLSGGTSNGRAYSIAVAVKFNGTYGEYNETAACTVYTPKGKKLDNAKETSKEVTTEETSDAVAKVITLKAYPNPFVSTFKLDYTPITLENVVITVYDMAGKQIEVRVFEATKANDQEFGTQYAAGIYNVNIIQGNNIQNIRVIKN